MSKLIDKFEKPRSSFPDVTRVRVRQGGEEQVVSIPTDDIFVPGDFVSRRFSTTPFWKIERWLMRNGKVNIGVQAPFTMEVLKES